MTRYKPREKGDRYRPTVEVLKAKNGVPTKVQMNGNPYVLVPSYVNRGKGKSR